jgi:hypothetical protein
MHISVSSFGGFTHGIRYRIRFTNTNTDAAPIVPGNDSDPEIEPTPTFHHFSHAGNLDDAFVILLLLIEFS